MRAVAIASCLLLLSAGCGAQSPPPAEAEATASAEPVVLNERAIQLAEDDSFVEGFLAEEKPGAPGSAASAQVTGASAAAASTAPSSTPAAATGVQGDLAPAVIQSVVRRSLGRMRLCYESALRTTPTLAGKVVVKFTIAPDGRVASSGASGDLPEDVMKCVAKGFQGLSFPTVPNGAPVKVSYPIVFSPGS